MGPLVLYLPAPPVSSMTVTAGQRPQVENAT